MKAVVLAGSKGRFMFPLTDSRPKAMLRVANKPLIEHIILSAKEAGINDFVIVVSYKSEQIRNYFEDGSKFGINITYRSQEEPIGTADALLRIKDTVIDDDAFLVLHGDVLADSSSIKNLIATDGYAIGVKETGFNTALGSVIVDDAGYAKMILEKSEENTSPYVNTGIYKLGKDIFDFIKDTPLSPRGELELPESISIMTQKSDIKLKAVEFDSWLNITRPWDILTMNELYVPKTTINEGTIEENVHIKGNVTIGKGTIIRAGSYLEGDILIGENCDIGPCCRIRGTTSVGNNCHIGSFVELKNSVVMDGSKVPHLNYVGDSVIGEKCNFGAGTKIANLRFDHKEIHHSGRHKLGALIGDNVNTGINSCINTGTFIGNNAMIGPGAIAHGTIMPGSKVC